jgi:small-conductance mechanosensitive channel
MNQHSPKVTVETREDSNRMGLLFWFTSIAATFLALGLGLVGSIVVPAFDELFSGFGTDLPTQTLIIMQGRHLLWFAFFFAAVIWFLCLFPLRYRLRKQLSIAFFLLGFLSVLIFVIAMWALYSPIFAMGAVAQ